MEDAIIYDGLRSPFGRHGGSLSTIRPDDLLARVIAHLVSRTNISAHSIEDVIIGNTNQAGEDSRNFARHASLLAGLPVCIGGITVNRLCGSGVASIADASRAIQCAQGNIFIAGGGESMSRAPWVMAKAQTAFSRNQPVEDSTLGARFPNPLLIEQYGNHSMAETADNIAMELNISRERCDAFAFSSQQKYALARDSEFFEKEIYPIEVPGGKPSLPTNNVALDEHPRPTVTQDKLASMSPLYANGVTTAGNASGINDGAAVLLLGSRSVAKQLELPPRGRIITTAISGVIPREMGLGPVSASAKALGRAGLQLKNMDVIEMNEAFGAQVLGCMTQMKLDDTDSRINPNGGAIAIGHPLGASGSRLVLTALRQLELVRGQYALVTMCIGVGQGISMIIERIKEEA